MKSKIKIFIGLILILIVASGCQIGVKTKVQAVNDGGVYISSDRGETWSHATAIYRVTDPPRTFSNIDVIEMINDPADSKAFYLTTHEQGIFYTYDGGTGWQQTLTGKGRVNAVAISPKDSCTVYAAIANKVYKSNDCNRHWEYKLIETQADPNNQITALAVDYDNDSIVYAGTSGKGLFRSDDAGNSWHVVKFFNDRLVKILIKPQNSTIIYLVTQTKGIFKTTNKGQDWQEVFSNDLKEQYRNLLAYRDLILDPTVADGLLYACGYGIFRSADGGQSWQEIKLLTPPNSKTIYALAVNPKDGKELYYTVDTVLYRSVDAGVNWITKNLPSARISEFLIIDREQPGKLYLGVRKLK
jgi:photosystem II stability/assembly factor-like uncharacterized protein